MTLEPRGAQEFRRRTSDRPLLRYALLQIPDILAVALVLAALHRWWGLDAGIAWLLFGLWIAKDALMYPLVRRALIGGRERVGAAALVGCEGVAEEPLAPRGRVRIRGESWQANCAAGAGIAAGTRVRVLAVHGLELQVEPAGEALDSRPAAQRS